MKVLDLFSGIGGFSLGLERAGMKTVAFCEIDGKCQRVLRKHWSDVPIFEDVKALTLAGLKAQNITVDLICGGFPCQDISVVGKGAGIEGKRSSLWWEYRRLISEIRPKYAIVENVSALLYRGIDKVLGSLAEIGYDAEWYCIPASAVGAPHQRDRVWIVAYPNFQKSTRLSIGKNAYDTIARVSSQVMADADGQRQLQQKRGNQNIRKWISNSSKNISNPNNSGCIKQWRPIPIREELEAIKRSNWWSTEPDVGRVAHGVPGRIHRLKQLGNAVVPQVVEIIGRAIMKREKRASCCNSEINSNCPFFT